MAAIWNTAGHYIFALWFLSFFLLLFSSFFSSPNLSGWRLNGYHTSTHDVAISANLECMSELNVLHAARWKYSTQKVFKKSRSAHHSTTLSAYIFAIKACIDNRKNLFNGNISSTCLHNMLNFGPLMAEICWRVWRITANSKGFRVLASLLHCTDIAQWRSTKLCTMFGRLLCAGILHRESKNRVPR